MTRPPSVVVVDPCPTTVVVDPAVVEGATVVAGSSPVVVVVTGRVVEVVGDVVVVDADVVVVTGDVVVVDADVVVVTGEDVVVVADVVVVTGEDVVVLGDVVVVDADVVVVVGDPPDPQNWTLEIAGWFLSCPTFGRIAFENVPLYCGGDSVTSTDDGPPFTMSADTGHVELRVAPLEEHVRERDDVLVAGRSLEHVAVLVVELGDQDRPRGTTLVASTGRRRRLHDAREHEQRPERHDHRSDPHGSSSSGRAPKDVAHVDLHHGTGARLECIARCIGTRRGTSRRQTARVRRDVGPLLGPDGGAGWRPARAPAPRTRAGGNGPGRPTARLTRPGKVFLQLRPIRPTIVVVELTQCPYDSTPIDAEFMSGGSMLLTCPRCLAEWEWHGAWLRRIREPNRSAVLNRDEPRHTEPA